MGTSGARRTSAAGSAMITSRLPSATGMSDARLHSSPVSSSHHGIHGSDAAEIRAQSRDQHFIVVPDRALHRAARIHRV